MNPSLASLPVGTLIALAALAVIELALDVVALVSLYRRPSSQVALGNKWVWVIIIVLVNFVGAILYFAVGRKSTPPAPDSAPPQGRRHSATDVADALYGQRDEPDR